ncbi:MAG: hypothetical protein WB791_02930 [Waddliaceae bacterium]
MLLDKRLSQLEKKRQANSPGPLMAFVGVPDGTGDVFKRAQEFWDVERIGHPDGAVKWAVPWPNYAGEGIKFLGLGSQADLLFGMCGQVREFHEHHFVFLSEVARIIMKNEEETTKIFITPKEKRRNLLVSDEVLEIIHYMIRE